MSEFINSTNTVDFIEALQEHHESHERKIVHADFQVIKETKGRTTSKGKTPDQCWMHPYLFIKFAMWINPRFEIKVIQFVYDELVKHRDNAGNAYRQMSSSIKRMVGREEAAMAIKQIAMAINHIVFGKHEPGMRNHHVEEAQMKELLELERKIASLIDEGFITSYGTLIEYLRGLWTAKWQSVTMKRLSPTYWSDSRF